MATRKTSAANEPEVTVADPVAVYAKAKAILAQNEEAMATRRFINPDDPQLQQLDSVVKRQQAALKALAAKLPNDVDPEKVYVAPPGELGYVLPETPFPEA